MNENSILKIKKEYIGGIEDLVILKEWLYEYHYLISVISNKLKDEIYINKLLKQLEIDVKYKKTDEYYDITVLSNILLDFSTQYINITNKVYKNFDELEDDKLLLYNILEKYIITIKKLYSKNKNMKKIISTSCKILNKKIPKSKQNDLFYNLMSKISASATFFTILLFFILIFFIIYMFMFIDCLQFVVEHIPKNILLKISFLFKSSKFKYGLIFLDVIVASFLSLFTSLFLLKCLQKTKLKTVFLNSDVSFARTVSEQNAFNTSLALILSAFSILISLFMFIKNLY